MDINETFTIYFTKISNRKRFKEIQDLIKNRKISYMEAECIYEKEDLDKFNLTFIMVNISYKSSDGPMKIDININDELLKYGIEDLDDMKNQVVGFVKNTIIPNLGRYENIGITKNTTYEIKTYLKELDYRINHMFKGSMPNLRTTIL